MDDLRDHPTNTWEPSSEAKEMKNPQGADFIGSLLEKYVVSIILHEKQQ